LTQSPNNPPPDDPLSYGRLGPRPTSAWRAPAWLQIACIVGLLGSALFVLLDEHYLWAILLAIAGIAFGLSFLLRRMVGDEYDRT
jgi:hypothetical protein